MYIIYTINIYNLQTFEQQINAVVQNCNFIEPQEIPRGYRLDSVKLILSIDDVRKAILEEELSTDGMLTSFIDGKNF